jgi:hypothetical protein
MGKFIVALAAIFTMSLAACANPNAEYPPVRAGGDANNPRAHDGGRAAGAGGSHAPGGTGLGAGTMGVETDARMGSAR